MANPGAEEVFSRFAQRAATLGVSVWWCSRDGRVLRGERPGPWVQGLVRDAVAAKRDRLDISRGRRGLALVWRHGTQVLGVAVAAYPPKNRRIEPVLRWTFDDLCAAARDTITLNQFSETLSQAYEETNLLFRLARLMNSSSAPAQLMTMICTQLQQVLPFGWVAIKFRDGGAEVGDLVGRMILAGKSPIAPSRFERLCEEVLADADRDEWSRLLEPGKSAVAAEVGAEIIAEPITHDGKVIGALMAGNKANGDPDVTSGEMQFMDAAADFLGMFHENVARFSEQRAMFMGMLRAMVAAIDAKDPYTCGHSERVALLASKMASAMELDETTVEHYRVAGLLHDVGKIGVPEAVLCKPGRLDEAEIEQIKRHPEIGYNILRDIPSLGPVLPGVLHHHEQWDGQGYPHRIGGEQIPTIARVLALADTFDAMSSDRSYRAAMPREAVLVEIRKCAGVQFDPALVPAFVGLNFADFDRQLRVASGRSAAA